MVEAPEMICPDFRFWKAALTIAGMLIPRCLKNRLSSAAIVALIRSGETSVNLTHRDRPPESDKTSLNRLSSLSKIRKERRGAGLSFCFEIGR